MSRLLLTESVPVPTAQPGGAGSPASPSQPSPPSGDGGVAAPWPHARVLGEAERQRIADEIVAEINAPLERMTAEERRNIAAARRKDDAQADNDDEDSTR